MSYIVANDHEVAQNDILTTNTSDNKMIKKSKQMKTNKTAVTLAINELKSSVDQAFNSAMAATSEAQEVHETVEGIINGTIKISGSTSGDTGEGTGTGIGEGTGEGTSTGTGTGEGSGASDTPVVLGGGKIQRDEFSAADFQTVFQLSKLPNDDENILFFVNGLQYMSSAFTYNAETNEVTWVNTESTDGGFTLDADDKVIIVYTV